VIPLPTLPAESSYGAMPVLGLAARTTRGELRPVAAQSTGQVPSGSRLALSSPHGAAIAKPAFSDLRTFHVARSLTSGPEGPKKNAWAAPTDSADVAEHASVVAHRFLRCSGSRRVSMHSFRHSVCGSPAPSLRVNPMPPRITQKSYRP
jgi:hypothetical protein